MKKWVKIVVLTGVAMLVLGSITALAAMGLGGRPGVVNLSRGRVDYISVDDWEDRWDDWEDRLDGWRDRRERRRAGEASEEASLSATAQKVETGYIQKVDVELYGGEVEIISTPEKQIQFSVDEQAKRRGIYVYQEDGELKVRQHREEFKRFSGESYGLVQIGIPETMVLDKLECEMDTGVCMIENISARSMDLSTDIGEIDVRGASAGELDANVDIGTLFYEGNVEQRLEGECGIGELDFRLKGEETDFSYSIETGMGTVKIGQSEYSGIGVHVNEGSGAGKRMELETGTGAIGVEFYQ